MRKLRVHGMLGLLAIAITTLSIGATVCSIGSTVTGQSNLTNVLPDKTLPLLLIGPDELAWDVILGTFDMGSDVPPDILGAFEGSKYGESWTSLPIKKPGGMASPDCSIKIAVAVVRSPEKAMDLAAKYIKSFSVISPEITGDEKVKSFADRVWYGDNKVFDSRGIATSAGITFVRHNVICSLNMSRTDGLDTLLLFALANRLSNKIDAALTGKPEPVPILPLAADQELRVDLEGAWKMRDLGSRLWGDDSTTIAIYDVNGIPRSLPAKRVGTDDYVVPLRHLAAIIGPNARVKIRKDEANVTLHGKALIFNKNVSVMKVGQETKQLPQATEFKEGEVLVPLTSVVSDTLGKRIGWEKRGDISIGRVE